MRTLTDRLNAGIKYVYATSSSLIFYGNLMIPIEVASGMTLEQSASARVIAGGAKIITGPVASLGRDFLENKLGILKEKNGEKASRVAKFDNWFWPLLALAPIGVNYAMYHELVKTEHGIQSAVPAVASFLLSANPMLGKIVDTFKDGFNLTPCISSIFPKDSSQEEKRRKVNVLCATAYGTIAGYFISTHMTSVIDSVNQLF